MRKMLPQGIEKDNTTEGQTFQEGRPEILILPFVIVGVFNQPARSKLATYEGKDITQVDGTLPKLSYRDIMNEKSEMPSYIGCEPT